MRRASPSFTGSITGGWNNERQLTKRSGGVESAQPAQGRRGRGASRWSRLSDAGQGGRQESRDRRLRRRRACALQGQDHPARASAGLRHSVPAGRVRRHAREILQRRAERGGAIRPLPARRSVGSAVRRGRGAGRPRRRGHRRRRQGLGQAHDRHGLLAAATGAAGQRLRGRDAEAHLRALHRRHPDASPTATTSTRTARPRPGTR